MGDERRTVLVVDDEPEIREILTDILSSEYHVVCAMDGADALEKANQVLPDLILLDIKMPSMDGMIVCETLRSADRTRHIPVILLTALGDADFRTELFKRGADDFVSKPFSKKELLARVSSKIRRVREREEPKGRRELVSCGNLVLNKANMEVFVDGRRAVLSVLEFNLLLFFLEHRDRVVTRERILEAVWGETVVSPRTVDTHVALLRKKLAGFDHRISSIYGAGYILKRPDELLEKQASSS